MYKALYRKYRPKTFNDLAGQKTIVQILKNSIIQGKLSHAYLFYGPRGTGKTSVAKIFAKTINCENAENGVICGKCSKCLENESNDAVDIIEIDAASNNGVDEIRELKSKVNLVPSIMKYKVYIIDEVHMLSIGAFNALLKTLEEPPQHVIFILATTELRKVLNTIVSRCQLMEFKKISETDMFEKIKTIANMENIKIEDDAVSEIVKYSDGGMRDALGLLDKLSLYSKDSINRKMVRKVCGNANIDDIEKLVFYIKEKDALHIVEKIDELYLDGVDLINVVNDIIIMLKENMLDSPTYTCSIILKLSDALDKIKKSSNPKIIFEASILEIISNETPQIISREIILNEKNERKNEERVIIDEKNDQSSKTVVEMVTNNNFDQDKFKKIRVNNAFVGADKEVLNKIRKNWLNLSKYIFDSVYGAIASSLMDSEVVVGSDEYIIIDFKYDSLVEKTNNTFLQVENFIRELCGKKYKIVCLSTDEWISKKKEYISKIKNGEHYVYINDEFENESYSKQEKKTDDLSDDFVSNAVELFGKEIVIFE